MAKSSRKPHGAETVAGMAEVLRRHSGATVLLHAAIAARLGLHATDHKCLDLLVREGPRTAGELAGRTGLTTGAITGVIDRLEAAGLACRGKDPGDRRRVIVEPLTEAAARRVGPLFEAMSRGTAALCRRYSAAELDVIRDFLTRAADLAEAWATTPSDRPARR